MSTAATNGASEDDIDPLDAYMDSLANEVTQQAEDDTAPSPSPSPSSQPPSPAKLAVANKVAASPFCNVLPPAATSSSSSAEVAEACLKLLLHQPGEFLSRFGHILTPGDLESLLPSQDPAVALHVARLQTLMLSQQQRQQEDVDMSPPATATTTTPAVAAAAGMGGSGRGGIVSGGGGGDNNRGGARVRNRRYRRLQQLAEGGVWFSDEAMKERDPWLWFEHVGKRAGEEKPAPKRAVEEVPGSTSVGTYLQESLGFLSQKQPNGGWPTGLPASGAGAGGGAGGSRGAGTSLGMAFLSGVCAADTGARDVAAGETVDCSDVPEATSPQAGVAGASNASGMPDGQQRHPRKGEAESSTEAVTAAVGAIGLQDDANRADVDGRRVRFLDEMGSDSGAESGGDDDRGQDGDGDEGMHEEEEEEEDEVGREEVARILSERFLAGLEEGVDYSSVDEDERLDDLDQLSRDEQDRWFLGEEDGSMDLVS
ncbi:unnamed protein product [Ectocarpus fasciculatus]